MRRFVLAIAIYIVMLLVIAAIGYVGTTHPMVFVAWLIIVIFVLFFGLAYILAGVFVK